MKKRFQLFAKLVALFLAVFTLAGCFQRSVVVTFNTNGGSAITEQIIAVGGTVDMPDDPTKTGYDFSGWFQDVDLTSSFSETTTVEENLTLYAKWTPKNYTVSWDTVGGNDIDPTTVPYRGNIARPSPNPTKEGFVFAGWYEDAAYTTAFSTNKTMPYNNITFYARWSEGEFSLAFDSKGGAAITPIEGTYGDELTLPEPTRVGYTFAGWYEEETYETLFVSETIPSRSMTLYAKWQPVSITVTFVEYEGVSTTTTVPYNQPVSEPASPTRSGYTFAGWEVRGT
ncbi:MAG: InlB B-repeat-containing protein, partial [Bacilli bacterium]